MGQQQLLLIILGVIIVGIAIAVGMQLFKAGSIGANSDAIQNDLLNIAAHADQFRIRPKEMSGGGGAYTTYSLPSWLKENVNGKYRLYFDGSIIEAWVKHDHINIKGESLLYPGNGWEITQYADPDNIQWEVFGELFQ